MASGGNDVKSVICDMRVIDFKICNIKVIHLVFNIKCKVGKDTNVGGRSFD